MMTYEIPSAAPSDDAKVSAGPVTKPCIYLPVSEEMLANLEVDQEVMVQLNGRVKSLASREGSSDEGVYEFCLEVGIVKLDGENEYTKLNEEDDD